MSMYYTCIVFQLLDGPTSSITILSIYYQPVIKVISIYICNKGKLCVVSLPYWPVPKGRYPYMFAMAIICLMFSERYVCYLPVIKGWYPCVSVVSLICAADFSKYAM